MNRRAFLESIAAAVVSANIPLDLYLEREAIVLTPTERLSISDIMTQVMRSRSQALADNIFRTNALFRSIANRGLLAPGALELAKTSEAGANASSDGGALDDDWWAE